MKNVLIPVFLLVVSLVGCASAPALAGRDLSAEFHGFSLARAQSMNEWWSK